MEQDRGGEAWSVRWSATAGGSDQLSRLRSRGVRPSEQQISGPGHQVRGREYEHYGSGSDNSNYSVLLVIFDTRLCDIFNLLCVVKINFSTLKTTSNIFQIKPFIKMCWHQNYNPPIFASIIYIYYLFILDSILIHHSVTITHGDLIKAHSNLRIWSQSLFVSKGCLPKKKKKSIWREIVPTSLNPLSPSKVGNKIVGNFFWFQTPLPPLQN